MKPTLKLTRLATLAAFALAFTSSVKATTISWGTYFSVSGSGYLYDSAGNHLNDNYVMELGSFGSTFIPTLANLNQWKDYWKPFDRASAPLSNGFDSSTGTIAAEAVLETDFTTDTAALSQSNTFAVGEQAYVWVYNDSFGNSNPSPSFTTGFEWALVTNKDDGTPSDDWRFPSPSGHVSNTLDWRLEDATFDVFGGLNNMQGPGNYSSTPANFVIQTHTAPVPEPSGILLLGIASGLCLRRRRQTK